MHMDFKEKQGFVFSLIFQCPYGRPKSTCSLTELRKLPLRDKISIAQKMDELRLDTLINQHASCVSGR